MNETRQVYLDNNATTRLRPEALEAMMPHMTDQFGNPSSVHHLGRAVRAKISSARDIIAHAIGADPSEIFFTSGGTESNNLAIKGHAWADRKASGSHIITSSIEHPAVLEVCKYLSKNGYELTQVPVDADAIVDPEAVREAIKSNTTLVTIMHANNEVGTIQPVAEITKIAKESGITVHTDAVQTFMKTPVNVDELGIDLLSISAHKVNGPKGVGALYVRSGTKMHPLGHGGHQERGIRAGTENVAGIIGFAKSVEVGLAEMEKDRAHTKKLRDELERRILAEIPHTKLNGHPEKRLPGTVNISFKCIEGEALLINMDMSGMAISTGSACSSGSLDPSHVLMAMDIPHEIIHGSLRFSFGHENTMDDVDYVMSRLPKIITNLRNISPLWDPKELRVVSLEEAQSNAKVGH
ncbi:Cysteine desulfurase [hydrothermal vent metagenome]|uniref:cysteine desulfurase n=1 Tax=hydrothermal vent metagenome TaxID=652676 RepID=A0A3B1BBP8_9ZZZZ